MSHLKNTIGKINGVLMCTALILLKISMEGVHLKLVKDIPRTFQNSHFIYESLFVILRSVRLQKILGNHKYGWSFHTPLEMRCATTLIQRRIIQSTSSYQSSGLDAGTLVQTRIASMKNQSKLQNSITWSWVFSTYQMRSFLGNWKKFRLIRPDFNGR